MNVVGIIAEYNPFHKGHQFHIEQAKAKTGADAVVVVMSGNFVQRGAPAIMPKHLRTKVALQCGASLVLELPTCYATGTAEQFAYGAVSMLHKLGVVDTICFGSECGDINTLQELADVFVQEPDSYRKALQENLRMGLSFPAARVAALEETYPDKDFAGILSKPNNILGIEYLKALKRLNSSITPVTITRQGSEYHAETLQELFSSATAIRQAISQNLLESVLEQIPDSSISHFQENYEKCFPVFPNDFSLILKYRLLNETKLSIQSYADVSEELANRIYNCINQFETFEQFCELLKTKELTYSRISRALLHILLEIRKSDMKEIRYARILGFRESDLWLLSEIKKNSSIPLISKLTSQKELSEEACEMLHADIRIANLYLSLITDKFKTPFINEYEHPIVRI